MNVVRRPGSTHRLGNPRTALARPTADLARSKANVSAHGLAGQQFVHGTSEGHDVVSLAANHVRPIPAWCGGPVLILREAQHQGREAVTELRRLLGLPRDSPEGLPTRAGDEMRSDPRKIRVAAVMDRRPVRRRRRGQLTGPISYRLTVPSLTFLDVTGPAMRPWSEPPPTKPTLRVSGSGNASLPDMSRWMSICRGRGTSGHPEGLTRSTSGSAGLGDYSAGSPAARVIDVELFGSGDATVTATDRIGATRRGNGDITDVGSPSRVDRTR